MMQIELRRDTRLPDCTLGRLYIDGSYQCETLEDAEREIPGQPVERWKVPGKTAIPRGTYRVIINRSNRFGRDLPLLLDVPGYAGVRIHPGNTHSDTEGCILVGRGRGTNSITSSRDAYAALFVRLQSAIGRGESVEMTIC